MSNILVKAPKKKKRALKPGEGAKRFGTAVKRRKGKLVDVRASEREKLEARVRRLINQKELELRDVESEFGKDSIQYKQAVDELRTLGERADSIARQTSAPGEVGYETYTDRQGNVIERRPDSEDEPIGRKESTRLSTQTRVGPGTSGKAAEHRPVNILEEQRRINKPKEKIGVMGRGTRQKYGGAGRDTIRPARADPTETTTRRVYDQDLGQYVDEMAGAGVTGQDSDPSNPTLIHSGDPMEPFHTDPTFKDLHEIIMRGKGDLLTDPETGKKKRGKGSTEGAINLRDMVKNLIYHKGELPIGIGEERFIEGDTSEDDFYTTGGKGTAYKSGLHLLEDLTGIKGLEKEWTGFKPRSKKQRGKKFKPESGEYTADEGKGAGSEKQISAAEEKNMFQDGLIDTITNAIRADHNNILGKLGLQLAFPKSAMTPQFRSQAIRGDEVNLGATRVKVEESVVDPASYGTQLGANLPPNHPKNKENRRIAQLLDGMLVPEEAQQDAIKRIKDKMQDFNFSLHDALDDTIEDLEDEGLKFDEPEVSIMGEKHKFPIKDKEDPYANIKFPKRVGISGESLTATGQAVSDEEEDARMMAIQDAKARRAAAKPDDGQKQFNVEFEQGVKDLRAANVLNDLMQSATESQLPVQQVFEERLENLRNQEEQGLIDAGTASKFSIDYQNALTNAGYLGNEPELTQVTTGLEADFQEDTSQSPLTQLPKGFQPLDETVGQLKERQGIEEPPELSVDPVTGEVIRNSLTGYSLGDQLLKSILEDMWSCR